MIYLLLGPSDFSLVLCQRFLHRPDDLRRRRRQPLGDEGAQVPQGAHVGSDAALTAAHIPAWDFLAVAADVASCWGLRRLRTALGSLQVLTEIPEPVRASGGGGCVIRKS